MFSVSALYFQRTNYEKRTMNDAPPPNWQRRQCPACGLLVSGLVNDAKPVADHPCGQPFPPEVAAAIESIEKGEFDLDDDDD